MLRQWNSPDGLLSIVQCHAACQPLLPTEVVALAGRRRQTLCSGSDCIHYNVTHLLKKAAQVPHLSLEIISAGLDGKRAPLLFVHGAYAAAWCWQTHWLGYFATRGHPSFALSLRGHGLSDGHPDIAAWRIDDYVKDLASAVADMVAQTGQTPILVAHSMGAFVALQYARTARIAGLALLAPVPPEGLIGSTLHLLWFQPALLWELNLVQSGLPPKLDNLRKMLFSENLPEAELQHYGHLFQHESERALIDMSMPQFDYSSPLGSPPTLVIGSADDVLIPPHLVHSTARFFGTHATIVKGLGHVMMLDAGWKIPAELVANWLDTLPCADA